MSVARRPLLTATAAATLLCALWFVPSANATGDQGAAPPQRSAPSAQSLTAEGPVGGPVSRSEVTEVADSTDSSVGPATPAPPTTPSSDAPASDAPAGADEPRLADTGSVDTTPYVLGGSVSLGIGVAFVAYSVRRGARAF
ncbi:cell wall protein [Streptomyces sp. JV176]|uniref:cell wall protein n=1 Tax=Streptomyces sp. JV176 TaxID=858630 RepID=UPI002E7741A1|nr:cell wall protein [Streptomyces sp. JV176]MEE1804137.1 cell wall protein [Streptomyces sp. JV176]